MPSEPVREVERTRFEKGWQQERHRRYARLAWFPSASPRLGMGNLELFWDFHFGILDAKQPTPNRIRSYFFSSFPCRATPAAHEGASRAPSGYRKTRSCLILERFLRHLSVFPDFDLFAWQPLHLSSQQRRRSDPRHHAPKQPPRQMTFRQLQRIVSSVLDQSAAVHLED